MILQRNICHDSEGSQWCYHSHGLRDALALSLVMQTPSFTSQRLAGADWRLFGSPLLHNITSYLLESLPLVPNDYPNLSTAIADGCTAIAVMPWHEEFGQVVVKRDVRVVSRGCLFSGCIVVEEGAYLSLEGVTVTGPGTGLIFRGGSSAEMSRCKVEDNTFHGIIVEANACCKLLSCTVSKNAMRGILKIGKVIMANTLIHGNGIEDDSLNQDAHFFRRQSS